MIGAPRHGGHGPGRGRPGRGRVLRAAVEKTGVAHAMFATGNSQIAFIDDLVGRTPDVPWADVVVFHMDEYVGIGPDHPASFQRWIRERIVEPAGPRAAHYLDGLAPPGRRVRALRADSCAATRSTCAAWASARTATWPSTTPRWPTSTIRADVKVVTLDDGCRRQQVNEGHFPGDADVPRQAVTVTIPALLRARSGAGRGARGPQGRAGPGRPRGPGDAPRARPPSSSAPPHATILLDADSGRLLSTRRLSRNRSTCRLNRPRATASRNG